MSLKAFNRALNSACEQLLYNEWGKNTSADIVRFITPFSDQHDELRGILERHWHILLNDPKTRKFLSLHYRKSRSKRPHR